MCRLLPRILRPSRRNLAAATHQGFTLVELVAVVAMGALCIALLVPAFARTKPDAQAVRCLHNLNQLTRAWTMYAADNTDRLIYNLSIPDTLNEISSHTYRNWANNVMDWTTGSNNTNLSLLTKGVLGPYLGHGAGLYHCPADIYVSSVQRALKWTSRSRSVSMNAFFGASSISGATDRSNWGPGYRQWLKLTQVSAPARFWVLLDEHPDSINDGLFLNSPTGSTQWGDIPASSHNGGVSLAFADGRAEVHKWLRTPRAFPSASFTHHCRPLMRPAELTTNGS